MIPRASPSEAAITKVIQISRGRGIGTGGRLAESTGILKGTETIGKLGTGFRGVGMAFRIRIVVGNVRAAVGLGDAKKVVMLRKCGAPKAETQVREVSVRATK